MSSRNIKLLIEYDGTHFSGWQTQPRKKTIQKTIETVLGQLTQEKIRLSGASRTDAGVHALGQVAHFRTSSEISSRKLLGALNGLLPPGIVVKEVGEVSADFSANRHAKKKTYQYLLWNSEIPSALLRDRVWYIKVPLQISFMQKAAKYLIGRHDFSAFRGTKSDTKTSVRTIEKITIQRRGMKGAVVCIQITGNGFLKYMVRNIVGTLVEIGKGRLQIEEMEKILKSKDRRTASMTAPPHGLYLVKVIY